MLRSIHLNDEAGSKAHEISDVPSLRRLTAEVIALLAQFAQAHLKLHLLRGHRLAQFSSLFVGHRL
jgi:hypothetical protein